MGKLLKMSDYVKNKIRLYRLGDFYNALNADAQIIAEILNLSIMPGLKSPGASLPASRILTGFPVYRLDEYQQKINNAGYEIILEGEP